MAEDPEGKAPPRSPDDVASALDASDAVPGAPFTLVKAERLLIRRVRLLVLCGAVAFGASTVLNVGLGLWTSTYVTAVLAVVMTAMWLGWKALLARVSARAVAHGTLGGCILAISAIAFGEGTTRTPNLHFLGLVVVASALLLGVRASRFWTAASILAAAGTYAADITLRDASTALAMNHGLGLTIVLVVLHLLASAAWRVADSSMEESEKAAERARAAAVELETANAALASAMQARSQFLANMSHEIRTPLNAVLGFTDVLLRTPLDNDQQQYVETIRGAGQGLLVIVDDVLDLARIEAGKLGLARETLDLQETIGAALDMLAVAAHDKGLEIWPEIDLDAPTHVEADAARARQVLLNLLGNAVKFTAAGEVVITLRRGADGDMARIEVRDTGPGIPPEAMENLFQPFGQADGSTRRRHGGTGLGLVISKKLVEGMGGRIDFESEVGKGSCFWIELPGASRKPRAAKPLAGASVTVVEGRARHGKQIVAALERHVEGRVARLPAGSSAAEVLASLDRGGITKGTIVVDWDPASGRPDALIKRLAAAEDRVQHVVLLAPLSELAGSRDLRSSGRVSVIHKPVRVERLIARLQQIQRDERIVSTPPPATMRFSHRVLLVEDNVVNQRIGKLMLQAAGCTVEVAADGAQAVKDAGAGQFDLVLMDLHMPEMDGFDATRAIRAEEKATGRAAVPIVALSASVLQEDQQKCLEVGMNGHLAKPILQPALEDVLRGFPPKP